MDKCEKSIKLYVENSERTKDILPICTKFLETLDLATIRWWQPSDLEIQFEISDYAFDKLYGSVLSKAKNPSSKYSSKLGGSKAS